MQIDPTITKAVEEMHEKLGHPDLDAEAKKIAKKLEEARFSPGNVAPLADCIVAVLVAARANGYSAQMVMDVVKHRCEKVLGREWKKLPDGTFHAQ